MLPLFAGASHIAENGLSFIDHCEPSDALRAVINAGAPVQLHGANRVIVIPVTMNGTVCRGEYGWHNRLVPT
jgi:hypothetical protein